MSNSYLLIDGAGIEIHAGDRVTITDYGDIVWIVKNGWYKMGTVRKSGWYFVSVEDQTILEAANVNLNNVRITESGNAGSTLDTNEQECKYVVIPGTNIRLYDGDIVTVTKFPNSKFQIYCGWYVYKQVQNYGWYLSELTTGRVYPVNTVDLTTCTLVTTRAQGSTYKSGPELQYTRPFTDSDFEILNRSFITVATIEQRDNLDTSKLIDGRMVRVNDDGGSAGYYIWDAENQTWNPVMFEDRIQRVVGTYDDPVILSNLDSGVYLVYGQYKVSPNDDIENTPSDILSIVTSDGTDVYVKTLDGNSIDDYVVDTNGDIVIYTEYATKNYVDERFNNLTAADVHYDNSSSSLSSTDVQGAIDELALGGGAASKTVYITETPGTSEDTYSTRYGIYQGAEGTPSSPVPSEMLANIDIPKGSIVSGTVSYWQTHGNVISTKDVLYIYTDWKQDAEGKNIPGIKVGDGLAYISDMPFTDELWAAHVMDSLIHVSAEDRANWNSKIRCYIDPNNTENIIFTTIPIL